MRHGRHLPRERLVLELSRSRGALAVIALGAIISIAVGVALLSNLSVRWPWQGTFNFRVAVSTGFGVDPGTTRLDVAGVPAGYVTGVRLAGNGAILNVAMDPAFGPIRQHAVLRLRPKTQLQDMYLDIVDRGHGTPIKSGATLSVDQTQTAVSISDVLDTFQPTTRERLRTLLDQAGTGLDGRGYQLREAFVELVPFLRASSTLLGEIADRNQLTRRLVHNSGLLFAELSRRDRQLQGLLTGGGQTLQAIAGQRHALAQTLDMLPGTLTQLQSSFAILGGALDHVNPALQALRAPVAQLPQAMALLQRLANQATPALDALQPAVTRLAPTVLALSPVARRLSATASRLTPQAPELDSVTGWVVPCRYAINKFFQNTLSFYQFGGPYGPIGRSSLVYGTASALGKLSPSETPGPNCYGNGG